MKKKILLITTIALLIGVNIIAKQERIEIVNTTSKSINLQLYRIIIKHTGLKMFDKIDGGVISSGRYGSLSILAESPTNIAIESDLSDLGIIFHFGNENKYYFTVVKKKKGQPGVLQLDKIEIKNDGKYFGRETDTTKYHEFTALKTSTFNAAKKALEKRIKEYQSLLLK